MYSITVTSSSGMTHTLWFQEDWEREQFINDVLDSGNTLSGEE